MTTGAPIYLVSACASGEEFVAAFRRYADKNGLFIPIASPLPAGRRGRFAVTLADGGVMIEGEADIVSSTTAPSILHGRVGMTLRFVEPDIKSKTVLVELEQARLALKPQPPSVPPRPAQVPSEPRPVVPAPAGRIDANNARAECVAIGDANALVEVAPQPAKPGPKFVVPSIPPVAAGSRPNSASTPPVAYPIVERKPPSPSTPPPRPASPSQPPPPVPPLPSRGDTPTAIATPIIPGSITAVEPPPITSDAAPIDVDEGRDTIAMPALVPVPQARAAEIIPVASPTQDSDTYIAARPKQDSDTFPAAPIPSAASEPTHQAVPEIVPPSASGSISRANGSGRANLPPPRRTSNTSPPHARPPTPSAPMPALAKPRPPTPLGVPLAPDVPRAPIVADAKPVPAAPEPADEPTDITSVPIPIDEPTASGPAPVPPPPAERSRKPSVPGGLRKTVLGVAIVPSGAPVLPAAPTKPVAQPEVVPEPEPEPEPEPKDDGTRDTALMDATGPTKGIVGPRSVDGRASTAQPEPSEPADPTEPVAAIRPAPAAPVVEEPSGDWTMIPGDAGPTILPRAAEKPDADDEKLPTGDWTIERVEDSPDGWSEPSKVDIQPLQKNMRAHTGPPAPVISGEKPLAVTQTAKEFEIEEETKSGLKVEVDSSLSVEGATGSAAAVEAAPQAMQPPPLPPMPSYSAPVPMPPLAPRSASASLPDVPRPTVAGLYGDTLRVGDSTSVLASKRRTRMIVIAVSAALAVAVGVVLLIVLMRDSDEKHVSTIVEGSAYVIGGSNAGSAPPITPDADVASVIDAPSPIAPDAGEPAAVAPEVPTGGACVVGITSTPTGAEIVRDKEVIGTTPADLVLPCNEAVKLVFRKARFANAGRTITPKPEGVKLRVPLARAMLSVKVTSAPPGATIFLEGKSLGVTPGVIKLPAFESSTLLISKPGFANENQRITPKQNNQAVHVTLKKRRR